MGSSVTFGFGAKNREFLPQAQEDHLPRSPLNSFHCIALAKQAATHEL
jgi:hypothetical protein